MCLVSSAAVAGDYYLRGGIGLDRPGKTAFTDTDCSTTVPAALCLNPFAMIDAGTAAHDGDYREECFAMLAGVVGRMCRRRGAIRLTGPRRRGSRGSGRSPGIGAVRRRGRRRRAAPAGPMRSRGAMRGTDDGAAWPVLLCAVLLAGTVAAAVSAATVRLAVRDAPPIASVRFGAIAADYALAAAGTGGSPEAAAADARAWAAALEAALARVAQRHRAVLLPARAVAAGAPDLTAQVEAALAHALARSGRDAALPPSETKP